MVHSILFIFALTEHVCHVKEVDLRLEGCWFKSLHGQVNKKLFRQFLVSFSSRCLSVVGQSIMDGCDCETGRYWEKKKPLKSFSLDK